MSISLSKCPNCSSTEIYYWGKTSGKITLHDSWWRCLSCSLVFANPLKTKEEIKNFYAKEFYEVKEIDSGRREYHKLFSWLTNLILKYNKNPKKILEIGCGQGLFLQFFSARVPLQKIVGVEFDKNVTDQIKTVPVLETHNEYYEEINFNEQYDLIFCWHVIEHVIDLHCFLQKIKAESNGVVVFGTPAFGWLNEVKARIQILRGKQVTIGTSSDHTFFFSKKVLSRIIKTHGFEILFHEVYVDNVNDEINFSQNIFKATLLWGIGVVMKLTGLPFLGKQVVIIRKK